MLEKICSDSHPPGKEGSDCRKWRRKHGLQLPLHPLQVVGWVALVSFVVVTFLLLIPALGPSLQPLALSAFGSVLFLHAVSHVSALLMDPADAELRRGSTDLASALEFGRCHLCNIRASGTRTKHCRACNKCVQRFDHHCKWLNQCVGSRNYAAFLVCVLSALVAAVLMLATCVGELFMYYVDVGWLDSFLGVDIFNRTFTDPHYVSVTIPAGENVFLAILLIQTVVCVVVASLLMHLCLFHVYISVLGVTTYEYVKSYQYPVMGVGVEGRSNSNVSNKSLLNGSSASSLSLKTKENCPGPDDDGCCRKFFRCYAARPPPKPNPQSLPRNPATCKYCNQGPDIPRTIWERCCFVTRTDNRVIPISISAEELTPSKIYVLPRRSNSLTSLPSLPTQSRVQSVSLSELNEILSMANEKPTKRLMPMHPARRQLRRKSNPQAKTHSLSPIHESGLSNPSTPHLGDKLGYRRPIQISS